MTDTAETTVVKRGTTMTIDELSEVCRARESKHYDDVVSLKSLSMCEDNPGNLLIKRGENQPTQMIPMDSHVYQQAPGVVMGLPGGYLKKLVEGDHSDPTLAALNFNHWVASNKDREVLLRFAKNGDGEPQLRAMLPGTWNPVPYSDVMELMKAQRGGDQKVEIERFNQRGLVMNLVTKKLVRKNAAVGDDVEWGMRYQDSDVGLGGALRLVPYTMTLWCTNGCASMNTSNSVSISHSTKGTGDMHEVMSLISQGMGMIDAYSNEVVKQMDAAEAVPLVEGPPLDDLFNKINKRFDVTKLDNKYVRLGWDEEAKNRPEPTVLRFANAYTRAANAEELKPDARFRLQGVGGGILQLAGTGHYSWN